MLPKPGEITAKLTEYASHILFYSKPKAGKSSILSDLSKRARCLIIDTEDSHKMLDSCKVVIDQSLTNIEKWNQLLSIQKEIYTAGLVNGVYTPQYDIIVVDTLTRVDEWSEMAGTMAYMNKPAGKAFNRKKDQRNQITTDVFKPEDDEFETVHELPNGFGYRYSRDAIIAMCRRFETLAPVVIYVCHVKEKFVGANLGEEVSVKEINLTGKVKDNLASTVDTIAFLYRDENKLMAAFSDEDGSRCKSLSGKTIKLSESNKDGSIAVDWSKIIDPKYLTTV